MNSSPPTRAMKRLSAAVLQPPRDRAEQFVADGMSEDVVGFLEMIEVEAQHREASPVVSACSSMSARLLGKRRAVRQFGQRIVVRQMGDVFVPRDQLGARRPHILARFVETVRRLPHLFLQDVEALRHLAEFVARVRS